MLCSKIPEKTARGLFRGLVTLEEVSSGKRFLAKVVDYCFEGQHGVIVSLDNKTAMKLDSYGLTAESDAGTDRRELDLRDIFHGHLFRFIT